MATLRQWLLGGSIVMLLAWSLGVVAVRWFQVKRGSDRQPDVTYLRITSLHGGSEVPQPMDEWPSARAAWLVYQRFRQLHPHIALDDRQTLRLQGQASESAILMSMAGRTAGEIISVNYRVLENWLDQDFLYPLDDYVVALARKNLSDRSFIDALPSDVRPATALDLAALTVGNLQPEWVEVDRAIWKTILRKGKDGELHVWAWPYETRSLALYYNRLLFNQKWDELEAAGLDPSRAPRTWEELLEYSAVLTEPSAGVYGVLLDIWGVDPYQRHSVAHLTDLLWQAGTQVVEREPSGEWRFVWDQSEGTVDAVRFLRELMTRTVDKNGNRARIAQYRTSGRFANNETFGYLQNAPAMTLDFSSSFTAVQAIGNPEFLGIAPLPAGPVQFRDPALNQLRAAVAANPIALVQAGLVQADTVPNDWAKLSENEWEEWLPYRWDQMEQWASALGARDVLEEMEDAAERYAHPQRSDWFRFQGRRAAPRASMVNYGDGWRIQAAQIDASMFGITRLATDPARRDAAWKYIHFLNSKEARQVRTDLMVEAGNAMFLNPEYLREFGYKDLFESIPRDWRVAVPEIGRSGRPSPNGANCQYVHRALARMADSALLITPEEEKVIRATSPVIQASWRHPTASAVTAEDAAETGAADPEYLLARDNSEIRGWIAESVNYANRRLLNRMPPEQAQRARWFSVAAVTGIAVAFPLGLWAVARGNRRLLGTSRASISPSRARTHLKAWAFMSLAVGSVLIWQYYPLARGALIAFQDYRIMQQPGDATQWVGLQNFARVFTEPTTRQAAANTVVFVSLTLLMGFFLPIFLAIMLDELPRGTVLYRVIYYLPAAMGGLVVAYIWAWMYSPQPSGLLNVLVSPLVPVLNRLISLGYEHRPILASLALAGLTGAMVTLAASLWRSVARWWALVLLTATAIGAGLLLWLGTQARIPYPVEWLTSSPLLAMICVIIPVVWAGMGPGCIIYLAALKSIPEEVYEAADIDGASPWQKIFAVTLPFLKPLIIIQFVGAFIAAFRSWESIFVMTGGGPKDATLVVGMEIWYNAFAYLRFGYAAALAWILGTLLIGFTVLQLRILRNARFTTAARD